MANRQRHSRQAFTIAFAAIALATIASSPGCDDGNLPVALPNVGNGVGGTSDDGQNQAYKAQELYQELEPDLIKECGGCHETKGVADTPFLGDPVTKNPDPYATITSWPQFVVKEFKQSYLLTHSVADDHKGTKPSAALLAALESWLEEEAKSVKDVSDEEKPTIPPFKPVIPGFNAVYLNALGAEFDGMAVTFQAEELTDTTLSLSELELHPTSKKGLKVSHPLFTIFLPGSIDGEPDPIDSFSNVVNELEPGASGPLGPGTLILSNWHQGSKLSIAFEAIATIDPQGGMGGEGGGGATDGGCKALDSFKTNAAGALAPCAGCHAGSNGTATGAVNMSGVDDDTPGAACAQILNRVNLGAPPKSQLFATTNPSGNATHPFKFGNNQGNFNNFVNSVTTWIQDEAK